MASSLNVLLVCSCSRASMINEHIILPRPPHLLSFLPCSLRRATALARPHHCWWMPWEQQQQQQPEEWRVMTDRYAPWHAYDKQQQQCNIAAAVGHFTWTCLHPLTFSMTNTFKPVRWIKVEHRLRYSYQPNVKIFHIGPFYAVCVLKMRYSAAKGTSKFYRAKTLVI